MEQAYKKLSDAELEIMQIVWEAGMPVTSSDVIKRITPAGRWANTTVLNFLGRLVEKGFLSTRKQGKCNVYTAVADEQRYLEQEGARMFKRLYGASLARMIDSLCACEAIDEDDLMELAELVAKKTGKILMEPDETPPRAGEERKWKSWYKKYFRT